MWLKVLYMEVLEPQNPRALHVTHNSLVGSAQVSWLVREISGERSSSSFQHYDAFYYTSMFTAELRSQYVSICPIP